MGLVGLGGVVVVRVLYGDGVGSDGGVVVMAVTMGTVLVVMTVVTVVMVTVVMGW